MVYVLKMEYVSKINIFGLNMMVKSGLKNIFEIPSCARPFSDLPCWLSQFSKTKLRQANWADLKKALRNFKNIF